MSDNPKIRYYPPFTGPASFARPMTPEEQQCDCGCMEIEPGPLADLTFTPEPIWPPKEAGVEPGYLVIRCGDEPTAEVARAALLHDGEGKTVVQIDHDSWQHGTIRGDL